MYSYTSFGLYVCSDFPLSRFPKTDPLAHTSVDVWVTYGDVSLALPEAIGRQPYVQVEGDQVKLYWDFVGKVCVQNGTHIIMDPLPGVEEDLLALAVEGVVLGILLDQRGIFTLHASAVAINDNVVGFIGWKGAGKSTTAAALHARGHSLVTDDILALDMKQDHISVLPGFPVLKLWPEAVVASFDDEPEGLPEIHSQAGKRFRSAVQPTIHTSLSLHAIYVLDFAKDESDTDITTVGMPASQACIELIKHSYALRFLDREGVSPDHLRRCAHIAQEIPIRRLSRPVDLSKLDQLAQHIETEVTSNT